MTEEQKELLKEKLKQFFDNKLDSLTKKIENDFNIIDQIKYDAYDNVIIPYLELSKIEEEQKEKKGEKEKNKETKKDDKKVEQKKKEEKKVEIKKKDEHKDKKENKEHKEIKDNLSKSIKIDNSNVSKTPRKSNKKKELDFKGKTEIAPKKTKVFSGKPSHKPELTTIPAEKTRKKQAPLLTETRRKSAEKKLTNKTSLNKKHEDNEDNKNKKTHISLTAYKPVGSKRFTNQKKPIEKKSGIKSSKKKVEIKKGIKKPQKNEDKNNIIKEEKIEEKKIVLKDKSINKIPDDLKNNNALYSIYLVIKRNYLENKEKYKLILSNPKIYKSFGNDVKFLLNDKKSELKSKIDELETFLKKYDDLPNIISKSFQLSTTATKSLKFLNKEAIENFIKKGNVPKEFTDLFKIILYILDIEFDENIKDEDLLNFLISELFIKTDKENLMLIVSDYLSKNKELNLTSKKIEKIENIIKSNEIIISINEMAKKNRTIAYSVFLAKEFHEFINQKTSDGIYYYELKNKNKIFQELKYKLATIENNGIPPKIEEEKKEEKKDIKEEIKENKEESQKELIKEDIPSTTEKKEENKEIKEEIQENKNNETEEIKIENKIDSQKPSEENQKVEEEHVENEVNK